MIRFRFTDDERRYRLLLAQLYQALASHVPSDQLPGALHAVAKIEHLLMLEGVRQGVAAAAISNASEAVDGTGLDHLKAFQLHAHVYGSQDTPLRTVELEWLAKFGLDYPLGESAWLDPMPMRFAPMVSDVAAPQYAAPTRGAEEAAHMAGSDDDASLEEIARLLDDDPVQAHPDLLDRARTELLQLASQGYRPGSWDEMIMRLHLLLQVDAGVLDIMLGSPQGRTVLEQAGCENLHPGALGLDLQSILTPTGPPSPK